MVKNKISKGSMTGIAISHNINIKDIDEINLVTISLVDDSWNTITEQKIPIELAKKELCKINGCNHVNSNPYLCFVCSNFKGINIPELLK